MKTFKEYLVEAESIKSLQARLKKMGFAQQTVKGNKIIIYTKKSERRNHLKAIAKKIKDAEYSSATSNSNIGDVRVGEGKKLIYIIAKPTSSALQKAGGRIDPTKFEGNIVHGMTLVAKGDKAAEKVLKELGNDINNFEIGHDAGKAVAEVLLKQIRGFNSAYLTSGNKIKSSLSKTYTKYGVSSTEPKTDMIILASGNEIRASVKNGRHAQFVSSQANETSAIFAAVLDDMPEIDSGPVVDVIRQTMSTQTFYKIRDSIGAKKEVFQQNLSSMLGLGGQSIEGFNDKIDNALKNNAIRTEIFKDIDKFKPIISDEVAFRFNEENGKKYDLDPEGKTKKLLRDTYVQIKREMGDIQRDALRAIVNKGFVGITEDMSKKLATDEVKAGILKESVTGNKKFTTLKSRASHILKWDNRKPETSKIIELTDSWFKKKLSSVKIVINDRGSGRGGAFRISEAIEEAYAEDISELQEEIYDQIMVNILTENIKDMVKGAFDKVKSTLQAFVEFASGLLARLFAIIQKIAKKGKDALVGAFGFSLERKPIVVPI